EAAIPASIPAPPSGEAIRENPRPLRHDWRTRLVPVHWSKPQAAREEQALAQVHRVRTQRRAASIRAEFSCGLWEQHPRPRGARFPPSTPSARPRESCLVSRLHALRESIPARFALQSHPRSGAKRSRVPCWQKNETPAAQRFPLRRQQGTRRESPLQGGTAKYRRTVSAAFARPDRKSTRLNSSHRTISYAVFCLKKKNRRTSDVPCISKIQ